MAPVSHVPRIAYVVSGSSGSGWNPLPILFWNRSLKFPYTYIRELERELEAASRQREVKSMVSQQLELFPAEEAPVSSSGENMGTRNQSVAKWNTMGVVGQ